MVVGEGRDTQNKKRQTILSLSLSLSFNFYYNAHTHTHTYVSLRVYGLRLLYPYIQAPRDAVEMRDRVVGSGGVPPLVAALTRRRGTEAATIRSHEAAALALAYIARTKELRGVISRAGALPPLLAIALAPPPKSAAVAASGGDADKGGDGGGDDDGGGRAFTGGGAVSDVFGQSAAQDAAQTAIINLVNGSDANRSLVVGAGALERLAASLAAGEMTPERERTRNAVILLRSLIFNSESNRERLPVHAVAPLVKLLDAGDQKIATNAAWCIGLLGTVPEHRTATRAAGGVQKLLNLAVASTRRAIAHAAVSALANLTAVSGGAEEDSECAVELIRLRAARPLTQLVASDDAQLCKAAGKVLRALGNIHPVDLRAALANLESSLGGHDAATATVVWRRLEHHTRGAGTLLEEVIGGAAGGNNDDHRPPGTSKERTSGKRRGGGGGGGTSSTVDPEPSPMSPNPLSPTAAAERSKQTENEII